MSEFFISSLISSPKSPRKWWKLYTRSGPRIVSCHKAGLDCSRFCSQIDRISVTKHYRVRLQIWTQEIEQGAQQAAQAGADHCALYSILCVQILRRTRYITPDLSWGRKSKGLMMWHRFCKLWSESSHCCSTAQRPVELSENILQHVFHNLTPHTVYERFENTLMG